jgi:hypothetical protein
VLDDEIVYIVHRRRFDTAQVLRYLDAQ